MSNRLMDPIGRLMELRYKSHPWYGIDVGENAPEIVTVFVEMVTTDIVKYEIDKTSGYLKIDRPDIAGDGDPLDICVLTEKSITHGNIIVKAIPIGGFRLIDGNQADDKIIAVLKDDAVYGHYREVEECPDLVITRLKHYFLTYKDLPGNRRDCEITHIYNSDEARKIIEASMTDYHTKFESLDAILSEYGMMKKM